MLKRFCTNPTPENGGQFCNHGESFKEEPCQDICPGKAPFDGTYSVRVCTCTCLVMFVYIILPRKVLINDLHVFSI